MHEKWCEKKDKNPVNFPSTGHFQMQYGWGEQREARSSGHQRDNLKGLCLPIQLHAYLWDYNYIQDENNSTVVRVTMESMFPFH